MSQRRRLLLAVVGGSAITAIALGVRSTFGLFLDPVSTTLGIDRGTFALAIAIQNIMWGLSQPVAGAIADRFGSARVLATGGVLYAFGLVLMSTATDSPRFFLSAGFLIGMATGAASFAVVLSAVGRMAPPEKRSMALGIVTAMGSVGQFFLVPITQELLANITWQQTAVVLSVVAATVALFTPVLRGRAVDQQLPSEQGDNVPLRSELRRAASSRSYVLLNGAFFVCGFHVTFIGIHLPSYVEDIGQTGRVGAQALALVGLFNIVGSLTAGVLGSRHSNTMLLAGIYGMRAVVIAGYILLPASTTTTLLFGAGIGLLWLSTVPLTSGIVTRQFGTTHSGTLFGIVFLAHQMGAFLGAWLGGELADATGSYVAAWWVGVGLGVMAMVLHLLIDESPVPQPPAGQRLRVSLAPAALLVIVGAMGITAATWTATSPAAAASDSEIKQMLCLIN